MRSTLTAIPVILGKLVLYILTLASFAKARKELGYQIRVEVAEPLLYVYSGVLTETVGKYYVCTSSTTASRADDNSPLRACHNSALMPDKTAWNENAHRFIFSQLNLPKYQGTDQFSYFQTFWPQGNGEKLYIGTAEKSLFGPAPYVAGEEGGFSVKFHHQPEPVIAVKREEDSLQFWTWIYKYMEDGVSVGDVKELVSTIIWVNAALNEQNPGSGGDLIMDPEDYPQNGIIACETAHDDGIDLFVYGGPEDKMPSACQAVKLL